MLCEYRRDECKKKHCHKAHSAADLRNIVQLYYSDHQSEALQPIPETSGGSEIQEQDATQKEDSGSVHSEHFQQSHLTSSKKPAATAFKYLPPFDLSTYKTVKCSEESCAVDDCELYHNNLERRRNPEHFYYEDERCTKTFKDGKYLDPAECSKGDKCKLCHTKNEFYYHEKNYKTKDCNRELCKYGDYCPDIHKDEIVLQQDAKGRRNDADVIEHLNKRISNLQSALTNSKKIAIDWNCPMCGDSMVEKAKAGIILCCKYMMCAKCIREMGACFKCKQTNPKAVYLWSS